MATSFDQLVRELKDFDQRREIQKACARGIRKAVKPAIKTVKTTAKEIMPKRGGLNVWVSKIRITAQFRFSGRKAGVKLKGGRNSAGGRSDIDAIDRGRVRAPSWGRRHKGAWHTQEVEAGFFRKTLADLPDWKVGVDEAVDEALEQLRKGR